MNKRPRIKPELNSIDKMLELAGLLMLMGFSIYLLANYSVLPETIPTHFNAAGEADGFGNKSSIFMLLAIATVFYIVLSVLNRYPHIYNYPIRITSENALRQYSHATRLIRWQKLGLILVFAAIGFQTIQISSGKADSLNYWFLPLSLAFLFVPLLVSIFRMVNDK